VHLLAFSTAVEHSGTDLVSFLGFDPSALGLTGFVSLTIVSIVRGWLVPRKQHDDIIRDRNHYRDALEKSEEARHILSQQLDQALEFTKTVDHILRSLPRPDERRDEPT
jgi:hypothetical protein